MKDKQKIKKDIKTYALKSHDSIALRRVQRNQYSMYNADRYIEPHSRNYYCFFFITGGKIAHAIDFQHLENKRGDVFFMAPAQVYLLKNAHALSGITLTFMPENLPLKSRQLQLLQAFPSANCITTSLAEQAQIVKWLENMIQIHQSFLPQKSNILQHQLLALLYLLNDLYCNKKQPQNVDGAYSPLIASFRQMLITQSNLNVNEYAARLHITPNHLNRMLKEQTGRNAKDFIAGQKLLMAKRLLFHSTQSVKEIAYESGFEDAAYFNRFFKKHTGTTPASFKKLMQEKYNS